MKRTLILIMLFLGSVVTAFSQTQISSPSGTINGHGYVDLGLSVKWATCNVGASSPSDYGNYYAWGEIGSKYTYTADNSITYKREIGNIAGNPRYDAARANWGGSWRLPNKTEMEELIYKCKWEWKTINGHSGYRVTGPNGRSIFLPNAGWRDGVSFNDRGKVCYIWSSVAYDDLTTHGYGLDFDYESIGWGGYIRYYGLSVRPVTK